MRAKEISDTSLDKKINEILIKIPKYKALNTINEAIKNKNQKQKDVLYESKLFETASRSYCG